MTAVSAELQPVPTRLGWFAADTWVVARRHMQRLLRRPDELLERFDLLAAADRPVRHYSGGMRRRLDLAVSLIRSARVLFLDEPSTGLDPRSRGEVWDAVRELAASGTTVLLTTQYLEEADRLCSRISVMNRGQVVAEGSPDELKSRVGGTLDDAFLHLTRGAALRSVA